MSGVPGNRANSSVVARRATGPRTAEGKRRSSRNALKNGIFSKALLLKGESSAEFEELLRGFRDDLPHQGTIETLLVDTLAANVWRRRRILQAEKAEIANAAEFKTLDLQMAQLLEAWDRAHAGDTEGGMLKPTSNPFVLKASREILTTVRVNVEKFGFCSDLDIRLLRNLFGSNQDGTAPVDALLAFRLLSKLASQAPNGNKDHRVPDEAKKQIIHLLDLYIENLQAQEILNRLLDKQRSEYQALAASVPSEDAMHHIIRYDAHLSREFTRTLHQLEHVQRMRRGQPEPPTLKVEIDG